MTDAGTQGGAAGAPGVLLFDDFEDGDSVGWTESTTGDWSIVTDGSLVYRQGTTSNTFRVAYAGDATWTDQVVEAKVKVLGFVEGSTSNLVGVYARFKDINNHYSVALRYDGKIAIRRRLNGSNNSITGGATAGIVTDRWISVKFEAIGSTLNAYIDGALRASVVDCSIPAGGVAVGTTNSTAEFDDIRVTLP